MFGLFCKLGILIFFPLVLRPGHKSEAPFVLSSRPVLASAFDAGFVQLQDSSAVPLQPQSALFNNESGGMGSGWFFLGMYVLAALVSSGLSGYTAVAKGLDPKPYFILGFILSLFGYLYVLSRPAAAQAGAVPGGLVKVPSTLEPVPCPHCGYTNHPAAHKCLGCGAALQPSVRSEVTRAR